MVPLTLLPPLLLSLPHLVVALLIIVSVLWASKALTNTRGIPGSHGLPLIGETPAFLAANMSSKGFYDFVGQRHARYGRFFKTNIFGNTHVFVSSIEVVKTILGSENSDFSKRYIRSVAELLGSESLLCASHEPHALVRRRISSIFTTGSIASTVRLFDKLTLKTLDAWERRDCVVVLDDAMKITFNAICKMLISLEDKDELGILQKDFTQLNDAMLAFPLRFPGARFYKGLQARKRIMNALREKIALRRKSSECPDDFLQSLLTSDDPLTEAQILDNIMTLIIAGQVTTASAITWMVYYLDQNPEIQQILRESQLELATKINSPSLSLEALNDMPYASKVVKESLRMASIVTWFPRVALKNCRIEGYEIKKGWIVNVDARSLHFDPTIYEEPSKFNPSRFNEDSKPYSFLAFGIGGRTCLGMNLAKAMMIVFLHRLTTTYRWAVTDTDPSLEKWAMFPRLQSGCPIKVTPIDRHESARSRIVNGNGEA